MDTLQIERNDSYAEKLFKGVYPKDQLPTVEYPGSYVVNTDPSTAPGEHWVAMFFNNPRSAEFFDSYCLHPIVYGLTDFFRFSLLILGFQLKNLTEFDVSSLWTL